MALGFFGVLLAMNRLIWMTTHLKDALEALGLRRLVNLG